MNRPFGSIQSAINEMIGHLSAENKEVYLKDTKPLDVYVDAKDEFDYSNGNYTTTNYLNQQPDEKVRAIQNQLNQEGYTDKFGNSLKEDGIVGGKTLYAFDTFDGDNAQLTTNTASVNQRYGNRVTLPVRTGVRPETTTSTSDNYPNQNTEPDYNSNTYINENGIEKWKELPYLARRIPVETRLFRNGEISTEVYNAFDTLSQRWYYAETQEARKEIGELAQKVRDNEYKIEDCTEQANKQLWENGQNIYNLSLEYSRIPMGYLWYSYVKNKGEWDYKAHLKDHDEKKADWMPTDGYFMYHGNIICAADFGNLNYGYTGTLLGLSPETLYKAGGMVATNPTQYEIDNYYSDSEIDHYWIKKGIEQANNQGYHGTTELPVEDILQIMGG